MKLTATHNDPQVSGEAIAALMELGFSNIRIDVDAGAAKTSFQGLRVDRNEEKFDTIVCPGGKEGVEACFFGLNKWRWVRVDPDKVDGVKYVAIYETKLDGENNNATGGQAAVLAYAPVLNYHEYSDDDGGDERMDGKYCFDLGEIVRLERPIPAGGRLALQNFRYTRLEDLLKAPSMIELFKRRH
jgi:hypothetical protein